MIDSSVEIKASETIMPNLFNGLAYFDKLASAQIASKTLVHSGTFNQQRTVARVQSWNNFQDRYREG